MKHKPGISWGSDDSINLIRSSKGWLAVYYHPDGEYEIIKIFKLRYTADYYQMMYQVSLWNYGTCDLCPLVKADIDGTA